MDKLDLATVLTTIFGQKYIYIVLALLLILLFFAILLLIPKTRKVIKGLFDRILKIDIGADKASIEFSQKILQTEDDGNKLANAIATDNNNTSQADVEVNKSIIKKTKIFNTGKIRTGTSILCDVEINNERNSANANNSK